MAGIESSASLVGSVAGSNSLALNRNTMTDSTNARAMEEGLSGGGTFDTPKSGYHVQMSIPGHHGKHEVVELRASFLNRVGLAVTFTNLSYQVKNAANKKETITLLTDLGGCLRPGRMTALMGPSGCGKTTLLDLLAGRKTVGKTTGTIEYGGVRPTKAFLRRYTGYVEQTDTLIGNLTVREMLMYTAELSRDVKEPLANKVAAVDALLKKLALEECKDRMIGTVLARGISGGQAKRTNIGIALVTTPKVLFLDEPTSGLDSYTANEVMAYVKTLIADGVTICATIHSPTSFAFRLFDDMIMLLSGKIVFQGVNDETAIEKHLSSVEDDIVPRETYDNMAEWVTEVITSASQEGNTQVYADAYTKCLKGQFESSIATISHTSFHADIVTSKTSTNTPWYWAILKMLQYRSKANYKNGEYLGPRIGDKVFFSLIVMSLYWGIGDVKEASTANVTNIASCLFMWCTLPGFGACSFLPSIVLERPLYVRERADGLFTPFTYLLYKTLDEMMLVVPVSLIFAAAVFFPLQLQGSFMLFWLVYLMSLFIGIMLAYTVGATASNLDVANALVPAYVVTLLFFGGFLMRYDSMPSGWRFYYFINFMRYAWGGLMANQFYGDRDVEFLNGMTVLETFSLENTSPWTLLGIQCCFAIFFFLAALAALQFKKVASR